MQPGETMEALLNDALPRPPRPALTPRPAAARAPAVELERALSSAPGYSVSRHPLPPNPRPAAHATKRLFPHHCGKTADGKGIRCRWSILHNPVIREILPQAKTDLRPVRRAVPRFRDSAAASAAIATRNIDLAASSPPVRLRARRSRPARPHPGKDGPEDMAANVDEGCGLAPISWRWYVPPQRAGRSNAR